MSFLEIFQPELKHAREERDRQKTLVTYPTHGAKGPLGIDLDSGRATIVMPAQPETALQTEPEHANRPQSAEPAAAGKVEQAAEHQAP